MGDLVADSDLFQATLGWTRIYEKNTQALNRKQWKGRTFALQLGRYRLIISSLSSLELLKH